MKKALLSVLAAIYMIVSTGMVIQVNYCMGEVSDLSLLPAEKAPCSMCGAPKSGTISSHCCSRETKFFKLGNDQKQLETAYTGMQPAVNGVLPAFTDSDSERFSACIPAKNIFTCIAASKYTDTDLSPSSFFSDLIPNALQAAGNLTCILFTPSPNI